MSPIRVVLLSVIAFMLALSPVWAQTNDPLQAAKQAQSQGKIDQAIELYGKVIDDPAANQKLLAEALMGRASLRLAAGKPTELALEDADRVIALQPNNAKAYVLRGICYRMGGVALKALEDFDHALKLEPGLNRVYMFKGLTHITLGEFDQAAGAFDKLNLPLPHYAPAFVQLARAFFQIDQPEKAIKWADKALQLNPNDPKALRERAGARQELGQYKEAMADYDQAIKLSPKEPGLHVLKSSLLMTLGDYQKAEAQLTNAFQLAPTDYIPLWWRARVRSLLGKQTQAMEDLEAAQKLSRGNMAVLLDRLALRRKMGDFDQARTEYKLSIKASPQDYDLRFARAVNEFMAADFGGAVKLFKESISEHQGGESHRALWLYVSQARVGQEDKAVLADAASELDPGMWPEPLFSFFMGKHSAQEVLALAIQVEESKAQDALAQARFFIAQRFLLQGKQDEAVKFLKDCLAKGPTWSLGYEGALAELNRMKLAPAAAQATLAPVF